MIAVSMACPSHNPVTPQATMPLCTKTRKPVDEDMDDEERAAARKVQQAKEQAKLDVMKGTFEQM
jgi:hypothetical protein